MPEGRGFRADKSVRETGDPLGAALAYLARGFSVIPIRGFYYAGDGVLRAKAGKTPLVPWQEFQKRLSTELEVREWWARWPKAAIGLVTGGLSGVAVVDFDSEEAYAHALSAGVLNTPLAKTGRGYHAYYTFPEGRRVRNSANGTRKIDVRGEGGYVLLPPSVHPSGSVYAWVPGKSLDDIPMAPFPETFLDDGGVEHQRDSAGILKLLRGGAQEGGRNDALARLCGSWLNHRLTKEECLEQSAIWNTRNNPPLSDSELRAVVSSVFRYKLDPRAEGRIEFRNRAAAVLLSLWPQHGRVAVEAAPAVTGADGGDTRGGEYDWDAGIRVLIDGGSALKLAAAAEYIRTGRAQEKSPWPSWRRKEEGSGRLLFSCWAGGREEKVSLVVNQKKEIWFDVRNGKGGRVGVNFDYGDLYRFEAFLGVAGRALIFGPPRVHAEEGENA